MKLFGKRAARQQALADLDTAIARSERAIPAGSRIYTASGKVAHVKSAASPGALCEAMREWTDWLGTGYGQERDYAASLPLCRRCDLAVRASGEGKAAS